MDKIIDIPWLQTFNSRQMPGLGTSDDRRCCVACAAASFFAVSTSRTTLAREPRDRCWQHEGQTSSVCHPLDTWITPESRIMTYRVIHKGGFFKSWREKSAGVPVRRPFASSFHAQKQRGDDLRCVFGEKKKVQNKSNALFPCI